MEGGELSQEASADETVYAPLQKIVDGTPGVLLGVVTDLDGVTVVSATARTGAAPEDSAPPFGAANGRAAAVTGAGVDGDAVELDSTETASIALEQLSKLRLGVCHHVVVHLRRAVVVYFSFPLLTAKLVARRGEANVGMMLSRAAELEEMVNSLAKTLQDGQFGISAQTSRGSGFDA